MNIIKNWGKWMAALILMSILTCNLLLKLPINLSYNSLNYWINFAFVFVIAGLVLLLTSEHYKKQPKTILLIFIFSIVILQNPLISGLEGLLQLFTDDKGAGFTFILSVPAAFAIVILYGCCFDYIKNKQAGESTEKQKKELFKGYNFHNTIITTVILSIIAYCLCFVQSYISMYEYKNALSSSCMNCSLKSEVLNYSFIMLVFFPPSCLLLAKMKNKYKAVALTIIYLVICFSTNKSIFVSRVTSWSTFSTQEELIGTMQESYMAMLISALILFCAIIGIQFLLTKETDNISTRPNQRNTDIIKN